MTNKIVAFFWIIALCTSLLWMENKYTTLLCSHVEVDIQEHPGQSFITLQEVVDWLQWKHNPIGSLLKDIDSYRIQQELTSQPIVKNVLVFKTWQGVLKICIETKQLIARIIASTNAHEASFYVDERGYLLPTQGLPLLRLLLVRGNPKYMVTQEGRLPDNGLLPLLHYLYKDPFLHHQITSLYLEDNGKIVMGTQLGQHQVEFGRAENIVEKLTKLRLFYKEVIPYKGWHAYHRVNLEFTNQLICA